MSSSSTNINIGQESVVEMRMTNSQNDVNRNLGGNIDSSSPTVEEAPNPTDASTGIKLDTTGGGDVLTVTIDPPKDAKSHKRNESMVSIELVEVDHNNIPPTAPPPAIPLSSTVSDDVSSSVDVEKQQQHRHQAEFSEENDVPERSAPVYGHDNLVKNKTLPRMAERAIGLFQFCSNQPRSHLIGFGLVAVLVIVCIIILVVSLIHYA